MMSTEKVVRSADMTERGADELFDFIHAFHENEGKNQAYLEIETDDGVLIDKVELIAETDGDGDVIYKLRLSGL